MAKQQSSSHEAFEEINVQEQNTPKRRPGGRSARIRAAVLEATMNVLQERGYEATSIAEIAKLAGVHETSVYRRWGTRETLMVEAVLARTEEVVQIPDTGELRSDLILFLQRLRVFFLSPLGAAITQLLASTRNDPQMTTARQAYWKKRFLLVKGIFERAMQRGEIAMSLDPQFLIEVFAGPFYVRLFLTGDPLHPELPEQIVDLVLPGVKEVSGRDEC